MGDNKSMEHKLVLITVVDADFNVHTVQFTNVNAGAVTEAIDLINDKADETTWLS